MPTLGPESMSSACVALPGAGKKRSDVVPFLGLLGEDFLKPQMPPTSVFFSDWQICLHVPPWESSIVLSGPHRESFFAELCDNSTIAPHSVSCSSVAVSWQSLWAPSLYVTPT